MASSDYNDMFKSLPSKTLILRFSDGTVITNDKIVKESLELEDNLTSDINLKYGGCESGNFRIRIVNEGVSFKDLWVDVFIVVNFPGKIFVTDEDKAFVTDDNLFFEKIGVSDPLKLGRYKVWSDKPTGDRVYRDLDCYDLMKDIVNVNVASWYSALTFPMTLKNFRDSLFTYLGVQQETVTLINDNYSIKGGYIANELSSRDMLLGICELNGVFGHINRDGKFDYISLPSSDTVEIAWYPNGASSYEDYETDKITKVSCYPTDSDAPSEVGTDGNTYFLDNNLLFYGDEGSAAQTTALTNLLNAIKDFTYRPFSVRTYGNPMMDLGTNIIINTANQEIDSFVMNRYLKGIQAMMDEYSAYGDMTYPEEVNRVKTQIQRTAGKTAKIEADVSEAESAVVLKVDSNGNIGTATLKSDGTVSSFDINVDSIRFKASSIMDLAASRLAIKSVNFEVDTAGNVTAKALTLNGGSINLSNVFKVTSGGEVTATSGKIGGWNLTTNGLYYGMTSLTDTTHNGVWLGQNGIALGKGAFKVTDAGALTATSGSIAGWNINSTSLYYGGSSISRSGSVTLRETSSSSSGLSLSFSSLDFYNGSIWYPVIFKDINGKICVNAENLTISGSKSRVVETEDYGDRLLYCYETPSPMFGDIGEGTIAEDGKCYIWLEPVFAQTINNNGYQVFIQKYGKGECYVSERKSNYFVVEGDEGLSFGWEIKAKQLDYEMDRLNKFEENTDIKTDYGEMASQHIQSIQNEREVA